MPLHISEPVSKMNVTLYKKRRMSGIRIEKVKDELWKDCPCYLIRKIIKCRNANEMWAN